jgi:hypothetical protein
VAVSDDGAYRRVAVAARRQAMDGDRRIEHGTAPAHVRRRLVTSRGQCADLGFALVTM